MIILHVANLSKNRFAGPNINVPNNVIYSSKYEQVALYNCNEVDPIVDMDQKLLFKSNQYKTIDELPKPFNYPDIVIFHGLYTKKFCTIANQLKKKKIPYVIVPRGSLTALSQKKKSIKKKIGNLLLFNRFVRNSASIDFLTKNEYETSKNFKFNNYFICGNGVELVKNHKEYNRKNNKQKIVTFIGRIEWYHKGLDVLIEAINYKKEEFRNEKFKFNLYGPNIWNSYEKLQNMLDEYNIDDLVQIKGPIYDNEKEKVILDSDIFIHTSRLEGQPTSIIEAINYGVPVFVTPGTNICDEVKKYNLGFISDFNKVNIADKLLEAFSRRDSFKDISKNEIKYAKNNFDWDVIVKKNISEYKKIIKGD